MFILQDKVQDPDICQPFIHVRGQRSKVEAGKLGKPVKAFDGPWISYQQYFHLSFSVY
jgi:hypothetical protein